MMKTIRAEMDGFMDEFCRDNPFSGSIRITYQDEIIYQRFFGKADYENDVDLNTDSIFSLYSLSKPFCAIGLLLLKDRGFIDIDQHPSTYLPEMQGFDNRVTIRQMLHHTSGLPDFVQTKGFTDTHSSGAPDELRKQLEELSEYPMFFEPGTDGRYANINFLPLALIIENITGLSYAEYMEREVFMPLGMKTAAVDHNGLQIPNRVKGYELIDGKRTHVDRVTDWILGAGDIVGTLDDVYCLNKAIKRRLLLKSETWQEALTPSPLNQMGMGCTVAEWHGKDRIMHNGGFTGFRSLHMQLPADDFDIILLGNSGYCDPRYAVSEAIYHIYYGDDDSDAIKLEMDKGYI